MEEIVEIRDLHFSYQRHLVLEAINLEIEGGDFVGVVGPNGGGKTTLLRLLLGLLTPDRGTIRVFGLPPSRARNRVAYVPQYMDFDPSFPITVEEVVLMGSLQPGQLGFSYSSQDHCQALKAMEQVEVEELRLQSFGTLSGGQKQRVLFARALVSEPELLLLDEPTTSVDSSREEDLYSLLRRLNEEMTIVLVTHDLGVISSNVNRVVCLNRRLISHNPAQIDRELVEGVYSSSVRIIEHECGL